VATKKPATEAPVKAGAQKPQKGIPAWFDLSRYNFLRELDAAGWGNVVFKLLNLDSLNDEEIDAIFDGDLTISKSERLEFLFNDVAWLIDPEPLWSRPTLHNFSAERFAFSGVSSVTCGVLANMSLALEKVDRGQEMIEYARARKQRASARPAKEVAKEISESLNKPFFLAVREASKQSPPPLRAVTVDLGLPDQMLVSGFKDWLTAMRRFEYQKAGKKTFSRNDFAKWVDLKYVPLFILKRWSELAGFELTYADMAEVLFPNRSKPTAEDIRKTHWKNVRKWVSQPTQDALTAQAEIIGT
jgi:hypothetical protein